MVRAVRFANGSRASGHRVPGGRFPGDGGQEDQCQAMHLTTLIVDDFFKNPDHIRSEALSLEYPESDSSGNYPGRNANTRLQIGGIEQTISSLVHERLAPQMNTAHGRPRLALEGEIGVCDVHIDFNHWSGIVYLSRPEDCKDGTHFFRHRKTGWDRAPVFPGEAEAAGYKDGRTAIETILQADARRPEAWERTHTVPMKFNRLVLFRGYLWHDAGVSFGVTKDDGRLILPLFFSNIEAG